MGIRALMCRLHPSSKDSKSLMMRPSHERIRVTKGHRASITSTSVKRVFVSPALLPYKSTRVSIVKRVHCTDWYKRNPTHTTNSFPIRKLRSDSPKGILPSSSKPQRICTSLTGSCGVEGTSTRHCENKFDPEMATTPLGLRKAAFGYDVGYRDQNTCHSYDQPGHNRGGTDMCLDSKALVYRLRNITKRQSPKP